MRYCPFCKFRILSGGTVCPNCHKTLPADPTSSTGSGGLGDFEFKPLSGRSSSGDSSTYDRPSGAPGTGIYPEYDFGDNLEDGMVDDPGGGEEEKDVPERAPNDLQRERARRAKKLRRRILVSRLKMAALFVIIILVLASQGYITIPEPVGSKVQPAVDATGDVVDLITDLWGDVNARYYKVPKSAEYVVYRSFGVSADPGDDRDFYIRIAEPGDVSSFYGDTIQDVLEFNYTVKQGSADLHFEYDIDGKRWYVFTGSVPAGETTIISLNYHIKGYTYQWDDIKASNSGTVNDIPQSLKDKYNHDESLGSGAGSRPLVQLDEVDDLAVEATAGKDTVYEQIRAIYDYIIDNIEYLTIKGTVKSCESTLEDGKGDCDDMSVLFAAMARSIGIPAWMTYGYLTNEYFVEWGGHAWINAYVPVKNDEGGFDDRTVTIDLANKMFLWQSPTRIIEWSSTGDSDDLHDFYSYTDVPLDKIEESFRLDSLSVQGTKYIRVED